MRWFHIWLLLGWFGLVPTAAAQAITIDKALVIVNQEAITLSEYQARHRQEVLQKSSQLAPFDGSVDARVLDMMIDDRIQSQIALRRGLAVSPQELQQAVVFIAQQNNIEPEQLFAQLAEDGITPAQFRASVQEQQLIRQLVDWVVSARVTVSDQEVKNYLASHRELITTDEAYEISHLFVALQGKSDDQVQVEMENLTHIRNAIIAGRPFAQSAEEFSDGPGREQGGYLGWRKVGQLQALFVDVLRQTPVGEVSEIMRSDRGLHLLQIHDQKEGAQMIGQQQLRHILIRPSAELDDAAAEALANTLHARIIGGEDFATIARGHSADPSSSAAGGLIGWVNPGDFPPEFESVLAGLEENQPSQPLRTAAGYHLVEVLDRRRVDVSLERAAQRARQVIFQRKAASFYDSWYGAIRDAAHIEYLVDLPG